MLTKLSPTMVKLDGMYVNKDALKMHLAKFTIANHFNYKVRTSHKECLHVVCLDDNCGWTVRATNVKQTNFFQIRRYDTKLFDSICINDTIVVPLLHDIIIV